MSFLRIANRCARLASGSVHLYQSAVNFSPPAKNQFLKYSATSFRRFSDGRDSAHTFCIEDDEDFDEKVVNSDVPVLVNFYAEWCGPCKNLGPRLECKIEAQQGKVLLAKINVDTAGDLADDYDVHAVPTVIAFKDGNIFHRFEGDVEDTEIDQLLANLMLDDDMQNIGRSDDQNS